MSLSNTSELRFISSEHQIICKKVFNNAILALSNTSEVFDNAILAFLNTSEVFDNAILAF
jgi:hypothetical protein